MVAVVPNSPNSAAVSNEPVKKLSEKQKQRLAEQKAREEKKAEKRHEKQLRAERRANEKEAKEAEREKRLEEEKMMEGDGLTYKEEEEQQRLEEEKVMLEAEFKDEKSPVMKHHVKKSSKESNRLGGHSMA
mmetsp:Transcript_13361/g.32663  ORF Transcript_13361/g.32663 Transcript_13361/m.32663 type:complete len:131 (+) Transcript_13361:80-472(+)